MGVSNIWLKTSFGTRTAEHYTKKIHAINLTLAQVGLCAFLFYFYLSSLFIYFLLQLQKTRYLTFPSFLIQCDCWYMCCDGWLGPAPSWAYRTRWYTPLCGCCNRQWILVQKQRSHFPNGKSCQSGPHQCQQCGLPSWLWAFILQSIWIIGSSPLQSIFSQHGSTKMWDWGSGLWKCNSGK